MSRLSRVILSFAVTLPVLLSGCTAMSGRPSINSDSYAHRVVYSGENFGRIAAWYTGDYENWRTIARDNPNVSPTNLRKGDQIFVRANLLKRSTPMPESFLHAPLVSAAVVGSREPANPKLLSAKKQKSEKQVSAKKLASDKGALAKAERKKNDHSSRARLSRTDFQKNKTPQQVAKIEKHAPADQPVKTEAEQNNPIKAADATSQSVVNPPAAASEPAAAQPVTAPITAPSSEVAALPASDSAASYTCRGESCSKPSTPELSQQDPQQEPVTREVEAANRGETS